MTTNANRVRDRAFKCTTDVFSEDVQDCYNESQKPLTSMPIEENSLMKMPPSFPEMLVQCSPSDNLMSKVHEMSDDVPLFASNQASSGSREYVEFSASDIATIPDKLQSSSATKQFSNCLVLPKISDTSDTQPPSSSILNTNISSVDNTPKDSRSYLDDFQHIAGQFLVLQTQKFIAQQLAEFDDEEASTRVAADRPRRKKRNKSVCSTFSQSADESKTAFRCGIDSCGRLFKSLRAVQMHQTKHGMTPQYPCTAAGCTRLFSTSSNLKYHMLTHTNERNFPCPSDGCEECFYTQQQLDVHQRSHTKYQPFICDFAGCSSAFSTAGNLRNHHRIHTGDKPFVCEDCGKRFTEKNSLKKHSSIHTGLRAFSCDVCGRRFTQSSSKRYHMAKQHGK